MELRIFGFLAPLLLTGCFLSPGKFSSELELLDNDRFSFTYEGEIQMLALTDIAQMQAKGETEFTPSECYDDETFEERNCTEEELAEQKLEWEERKEAQAASNAREAEQMRAILGGIDPKDPKAAEELAAKLERQRNWESVAYKGNGLFEVRYSVTGSLDTDFAFPMIEQMPMNFAFLNVVLRDDKQVRIEAPGFATNNNNDPMSAMIGGGMGLSAIMRAEAAEEGKDLSLASPEGTFRIVTNGRILANNTDEGPSREENREILSWEISPRTQTAPMALISFE